MRSSGGCEVVEVAYLLERMNLRTLVRAKDSRGAGRYCHLVEWLELTGWQVQEEHISKLILTLEQLPAS